MREITEMMVRQCAPPEILRLVCRFAGQTDARHEIALFLIEGPNWTFSAKGDLSPQSEAALSRIHPARISDELFQAPSPAAGPPEYRFDGGWARHLYSGAGELLGLIVGFSNGSPLPSGPDAMRIQLVCRLVTLVVEQSNLIGDLSFRAQTDNAPDVPVPGGAWDSHASLHQVTQMIAQQCAPEEILAVLCNQAGESEAERQVAFLLIQDSKWRLAAKGPLTPQSEAALALVDPESLSEKIFESDTDSTGQFASSFEAGWARHLFSGTGELLGLMVGLHGGPARPQGVHASRIESTCCLAVLAIEQTNLTGELAFKADHDWLTGLPNRSYHERLLRSTLRESVRTNRQVALLYINLDRFRLVNDVIGQATGDRLLEDVGRRLQSCVRAEPMLAHMGGDEFAVLIPGIAAPEDAGAVAARLLHSLSTPFSIDGHDLFAGASIGIACSTPESTPESLEREAYLALYEAKRTGKAKAMFFHSSMATVSPERLEMEKRLHSALARGEFLVYYQPQIELSTGRVRGAEALLRWRPEGLGLVSPVSFVPILEETGLIVEVGRWVLCESCRQGKEWLDRAGLRLRIGVNVSAIQLLQPDFCRHVKDALAGTGFPPELLELELTESLFVGETGPAARVLRQLETLGVGLALDDFGTGQSSLSYLHRLPFHRLKIDQSFIRGIVDGEECPPILRNIVQMAGSLGMNAIAEGVETAHQAELLRLQECEEGQGYFFSRALPSSEIADYCANYHGPEGLVLAETGFGFPPVKETKEVKLIPNGERRR